MPASNLTFCINTSLNEKNHVLLLLRSMQRNLSRRDYPILVFIESDPNGFLTGLLVNQKEHFPNLKIIKNPLPVPVSCARNINMMFEMAETDVVSYLQSDMVIAPDYDLAVASAVAPDTIISATRVEPPLHPPSPEKITIDFGLDPTKFDMDRWTEVVKTLKSDKTTDFWFAPFTLYKKAYLEMGGYDTLFRRSRDDSDLLYRFSLAGLKTKQVWDALVYHFTCTSSRGIEWWTEKAQEKTRLQEVADRIEMSRFLRKWPKFKHSSVFDPDSEYKYRISANFYNAAPRDIELFQRYFMFHRTYVSNPSTRAMIRESYGHLHDPANQLTGMRQMWDYYKKYYRTWEYEDIYSDEPITDDDIIFDVDLKGQTFDTYANDPVFANMQELIHSNRHECPGQFEIDSPPVKITMNRAVNRIMENLVVKNPPVNDIPFRYL